MYMSLPTLTRAPRARSGEAAAHTQRPFVFESKISAQLAGLILYVMIRAAQASPDSVGFG